MNSTADTAVAQPSLARLAWRSAWLENPGFTQLLGLCPLLAVTTSVVNALGLGIATLLVVTLSNTAVSLSRHALRREIRIPAYVLIIASLVTSIELIMRAWFPELDRNLGIFVPLIVTNCAIVARAEAFASRNRVLPSIVDGIATGAGFALVLFLTGAVRELLGQGSLFAQSNLLFGGAASEGIRFHDGGLLIALLPPGAFLALAALIALRNYLGAKLGGTGEVSRSALTDRSS